MRRFQTPTPIEAVAGGLAAAVAGTAVKDLVGFMRYRSGGGKSRLLDWEFSAGVTDWTNAPDPAQVGRRVVEGVFDRELPASFARATNNTVHWAYGSSWGALYGLIAGSLPEQAVSGMACRSGWQCGPRRMCPCR